MSALLFCLFLNPLDDLRGYKIFATTYQMYMDDIELCTQSDCSVRTFYDNYWLAI